MAIEQHQLSQVLDSSYFNLILFPTEQCNFRCTYCYEDFALHTMPPEVVEGVKSLLSARAPELDNLEISWFGGEPLVAKQVIFDIGERARDLSQEYGFSYHANMTTNGSLLNHDTLEKLVVTGVRTFQISLDGPPEVHDQTRVRGNGKGTFAQIWRNLAGIRDAKLEVKVILRVHIAPSNYEQIRRLIAMINDEFATDERFFVYFKTLEKLGGPNDATFDIFPSSRRREVRDSLQSLLANPLQIFDVPSKQPYICYASKPNSLAVRADGTVAKCTVALGDPRNRVGELQNDGTMSLNQDKLRFWFRGLQTLDETTLACPWGSINSKVNKVD